MDITLEMIEKKKPDERRKAKAIDWVAERIA